ncbi:MAG: response regulator [Ruminococcus sp.]|nr:response regulator [Ruminococcus sp.]
MDNKLSVLLVEDDPTACNNIIDIVDNSDDICLVGVTNNDCKAIEYISDCLPDVVILDLELQNGSGSGLNVLNKMKKLSLAKLPYILVTTNNSSAITLETARNFGADYIMSKHQQNYSEQSAIDFIRMLAPVIKGSHKSGSVENEISFTPEHNKKRIKRRIMAELDKIGISQKAVGYKYLVDGIYINLKEPTQNICVKIGKIYGKTESSVERAMQNAINRAWATSDIEDLLRYYTARISSSKGVPTLTEFIFYYVNKLKNEY